MSSIEQFLDDTCLFCGKKGEERFYSGSYETYYACNCCAYADYIKTVRLAEKLAEKAVVRREFITLSKKVAAENDILECHKRELEKVKDKLNEH